MLQMIPPVGELTTLAARHARHSAKFRARSLARLVLSIPSRSTIGIPKRKDRLLVV